FFGSPAPAASACVSAGMLYTTQCHQPLPVGASGSCTMRAKLLVSAGAPLQASAGETLPPWQPKPLNTCAAAMVAPGDRSVLVSLNVDMACVSFAAGASAASSLPPASATIAKQALTVRSVGLIAAALLENGRLTPAGQCRAPGTGSANAERAGAGLG